MSAILEFFGRHNILFIILSILLIFALIGYLMQKKRGLPSPYEVSNKEDDNLTNISNVAGNVSLQEVVSQNMNMATNNNINDINTVNNNQIENLN
jgi:hypothetical protein